MKIGTKKAQHEIAGFVLIVLIVSVIGVVFLTIAFSKGTESHNSIEVSNLLESSMYYTTDCAMNYIPNYREMEDLIKDCYKSMQGSYKECMVKEGTMQNYGTLASSTSYKKFSLTPQRGPWEHTPEGVKKGTASDPLLVLSGLKKGEEIKITNIKGKIKYVGSYHDCKTDEGTYGFPARAGFYNDKYELIGTEYNLRDFERGIVVPEGAKRLYAYIRETYRHRMHYQDNTGTCVFDLVSEEVVADYSIETEERDVCDVLDKSLKNLLDTSLNIGERHVNKAYKLDLFYSSESEGVSDEHILDFSEGNFNNCSAIVGGSHAIPISSFEFGALRLELDVCKGSF